MSCYRRIFRIAIYQLQSAFNVPLQMQQLKLRMEKYLLPFQVHESIYMDQMHKTLNWYRVHSFELHQRWTVSITFPTSCILSNTLYVTLVNLYVGEIVQVIRFNFFAERDVGYLCNIFDLQGQYSIIGWTVYTNTYQILAWRIELYFWLMNMHAEKI